jgi:hypothetical protein
MGDCREGGAGWLLGLLAVVARSWRCEFVTGDADCVLELADVIATEFSPEAHASRVPSSRLHDARYAPAVVCASIVRPSAPSVIGTLRGFADSATGMRRISTPVS